MRTVGDILWRRLDTAGHDACRLLETTSGWRVEGTALFGHAGRPAHLHYRVTTDRQWRTLRGEVRGWTAGGEVNAVVTRGAESTWSLNGVAQPLVSGCQDLDLGFTPATNLLQLRRLGLAPGSHADYSVAWLDVAATALQRVPQRYERLTPAEYGYAAPGFGYAATLVVSGDGFVTRYPGLWEAESL